MSLIYRTFQSDNVSGVVYDFTEVGDVLPLHTHGSDRSHLSIILGGELLAFQTGKADKVLKSGAFIDWPYDIEHGWRCLKAPARLVNITKTR